MARYEGAGGMGKAPRPNMSERQPETGSLRRTATDRHLCDVGIRSGSGVHDHLDGVLVAVTGHTERFRRLMEPEVVGYEGVGQFWHSIEGLDRFGELVDAVVMAVGEGREKYELENPKEEFFRRFSFVVRLV